MGNLGCAECGGTCGGQLVTRPLGSLVNPNPEDIKGMLIKYGVILLAGAVIGAIAMHHWKHKR